MSYIVSRSLSMHVYYILQHHDSDFKWQLLYTLTRWYAYTSLWIKSWTKITWVFYHACVHCDVSFQISYSSGSPVLSDRTRFRRYFRDSPSTAIVAPSLRSTAEHFNWTRIALITQDENLFRAVRVLVYIRAMSSWLLHACQNYTTLNVWVWY